MKNLFSGNVKRTIYILAVTVSLTIGALAQSNSGTITGQVLDANEAAIPNATVTVTNVGTSESRTVQTNEEGFYEIPALSTGTYRVVASAGGFQETTVSDARLSVGDRLRINVKMSTGGVSAVVQVADQTPTDTETSTLGDTIGTARIADNPVNGRDFTQLLATIPGSVQTTNQFQTTINGIPSTFGGTSVLVDGIDASRVDVNGTSNVLGRIESRVNRVSIDSIQEVQVVEQNYSAQYGQALGAVINPITKSGTNEFHGGAFDYFRNEALDAPDALAGKQRFRLNQFGVNVSGPIAKDKVFFFTNYEGVRQSRGQSFNVLVPTQSFRSGMNATIRPVVDTIPLPTSPYLINVNGQQVQSTDLGRYMGQRIGDLREDTGSVKLDWLQSDRSQFSVRYNLNDSDTEVPYGVGSRQTADGKLRTQLFKLSNNYVIGATTSNEFGFGINHNYTSVGAGDTSIPRFDLTFVDYSITPIGPAQFDQKRTGVVYHFLDTLTTVRGDHSLKMGADIRLNRRAAESFTQDTLTFFSLADFRNNAPFVISRNGHPELNYANENFSFFINDDWKAHPRLSLNLGLRYEVSTVSREKNGRLQNFDLSTLRYTAPGEKIHNVDKNNFGPRVGFAFDVFGTQKTVLRGGYGIFYNRELPASFGSPQANSFPQVATDLFDYFFCAAPPPTFSYPVDPRVFACGQAAAFVIEKDLKTAMAQHWSLNVQQDFGVGTLTVGYVGNHVTHLLTDGVITPININRANPVTAARPLTEAYGDIFLVGGYPQSNYNAMQVNFKRNLSQGVRFNSNYTWSHTIDDVVGFFKDYQDPNNARAERASSDQDVRHNFTFDAGYNIPLRNFIKGVPDRLVDGWQINTIIQARSGLPVNVREPAGSSADSPSDRISFRASIRIVQITACRAVSSTRQHFRSRRLDASATPDAICCADRISRRLTLRSFKNTKLTETTSLQLRLEVFNLFNFANYADPSGGLSCSGSVGNCAAFGVSTSTVGNQLGGLLGFGGPRQVQLSARFIF